MFDAVPQDWRRTTLGEVVTLEYGRSLPEALRTDGDVPVYGSNGPVGFHAEFLVGERGIVVGRKGTAGSVRVTAGPFWPIDTTYYVQPRSEVDFDWLAATLRHANLGSLNEATGVPGLNRENAYRQPILLPPLDEQRRIAEVLRSVDEAVTATEAAINAATSVRQSALDALMRDLVQVADNELPVLSEVAEVRTGLAKNKNAYGRHVRLPYLRVANVQDGWFDLSDMQEIDVEPEKVDRYSLKAGDVLLTEGGDYDKLGRGGVWKAQVDPCLHQNHVFCVRPDPARLLPDFLALVTQSFLGRSYFLSCAKRTTNLASINSSQLKGLPLPVPDLERQRAVAAEIGCVSTLIEREEDKRGSLLRIRASLQGDLLSGRVRVPALAASDTPAPRVVQPAFKRAVLAAEIVHQLHKDAKFGSVKHEKIVHLCELHAHLHEDLDRHAYKEAAGPYDPKARRSVEKVFRAQKWFEVTKSERRVEYVPLERCGSHRPYYERYFGKRHLHIQSIIDRMRPMTSEQCEIVATLYAVWNDFLLDGETPTDQQIVESVLNSWHPSKRNISEDRWLAALPWMRSNDLVPQGVGEKTRVVSS